MTSLVAYLAVLLLLIHAFMIIFILPLVATSLVAYLAVLLYFMHALNHCTIPNAIRATR